MASHDYDLFVIGGGSGGVRAARIAANHGVRVAIAEEDRYGGTCVIRGCVPKKLLVYASEYRREMEDAAGYGWTIGDSTHSWKALIERKDKEIDRLNAIYIQLLERNEVEVFHDRAVLRDAHTLAVGDRTVTARYILVATGGRPFKPATPGVEHAITSNEAFHLDALPRRITVVGGGYIAVEFAAIFAGLGAQVSLVHRRAQVLRGFDADVRRCVTDGLALLGVDMRLEVEGKEIIARPDGSFHMPLTNGQTLETDLVFCATGRSPNTSDMGLEAAGVRLEDSGAVVVDEYSKTSVEGIYAVGDCTDRINLTPVAIHEGHAFADTVFGNAPRPIDHDMVASAVFSQPPVGTVGLSESDARKLSAVDVYTSEFKPMRHTMSGRDEQVMIKLVVASDTQRVVGAHIVGRDAPEIVQALAIAIKMGATKADLDRTMAVHPTTAEELVLMRTKREMPMT
jgi:glutathione reductase (NADPH)